jgi:hypothetical protein
MRFRSLLVSASFLFATVLAAAATSASAAVTYPQFPALSTLITGIVGYQLPVVCEPSLAQGAAISDVSLNIDYAGRQTTYVPQYPPFSDNEDGVTLFASIASGAIVTVSYKGQTATLPPVPATTPRTREANVPPPYAVIPVAIALDVSACSAWTAARDGTLCGVYCGVNSHGAALLVAIHEAMHAKYADGDEALTECRAVQAFPGVMSSLFPALADPGKEPARPKLAAGRLPSAKYRAAVARWKKLDATWRVAETAWSNQAAVQAAMTSDAHTDDAHLPPEYHGGSC